jgi:hypothetical protein
LAPGTYTVTVSAPWICDATATATIVAPPPVTVTAMDDTTVCNDADLTLTAVGGGGTASISYDWSPAGHRFARQHRVCTPWWPPMRTAAFPAG